MAFFKYLLSKTFLRLVISLVLILIISVFVLTRWLNYTTHHDEKIRVPNLDKISLTDVTKILDSLHLKAVVIDSASFNPTYPVLSVIEQNPLAGDFVKEYRKIYLTLNPSGYRKVTIPKIYGKTLRQAVIEINNIGLRIGENPTYIPDKGKDVVRGLKLGEKYLLEGDKIARNAEVEFILGDGKGN
ncbi:MAG: serine/threonine protein kinase [Flavobacteriaceae bacterium]|nr:serine/threonine protein kinase [Flavobacteriaceae bacterium]